MSGLREGRRMLPCSMSRQIFRTTLPVIPTCACCPTNRALRRCAPAQPDRPGGDPLHRTARPGHGARNTASACSTTAGTGNSGHYYIDRDGSVHQFVPPTRIAHHTRGYNPRSIGIELVNTGRYPDWLDSRQPGDGRSPTPRRRSRALMALLLDAAGRASRTCASSPGTRTSTPPKVAASDDPSLQVYRKRDPGPLFPWDRACWLPCAPGTPATP